MEKHYKDKHGAAYKDFLSEKKKLEPSASSSSLIQRKITDFKTSSEVSQLCTNLVVEDGIPLHLFRSRNMNRLTDLACIATKDEAKITDEKIRDKIIQNAEDLRGEIQNLVKKRLISFKVDMASCRGREFIGMIVNNTFSNHS